MFSSHQNYTTEELNRQDVSKALEFIPKNSHEDFNRLLKIIIDSGVDGFAALAALYRWIRDRPQYEPIYNGLQQYFETYEGYFAGVKRGA